MKKKISGSVSSKPVKITDAKLSKKLGHYPSMYWKEKFTRFGKEIIYLEFESPWQEGMNCLFVYQS